MILPEHLLRKVLQKDEDWRCWMVEGGDSVMYQHRLSEDIWHMDLHRFAYECRKWVHVQPSVTMNMQSTDIHHGSITLQRKNRSVPMACIHYGFSSNDDFESELEAIFYATLTVDALVR